VVEHEEGEREVRLARELEAAHEEHGPLAQLLPALLDEPPHRAKRQLGEARVGVRHVVDQRQARVEVVEERRVARRGARPHFL
jgi:hypothetical protein